MNILVIHGHPDPADAHFGNALGEAYAQAAEGAGHVVRRIEVAQLDFPLLRTRQDWISGDPPAAIANAQADVLWADHLVIFYPLWLGAMPALLKGFFEQLFRQRFAFGKDPMRPERPLRGRSARIVVTMGMPAFVYRFWFLSHSLKNLERNILRFCGIRPVRSSLVGLVEGAPARRRRWLRRMARLGVRAG